MISKIVNKDGIAPFAKTLTLKVKLILTLVRVKCNRCGRLPEPIQNVARQLNFDMKKKPFQERAGDWVCLKCKNLNFSFRVVCNRCQCAKDDTVINIL